MTKSSTPTIDEAGAGPAAGRRRRWRVGAVLVVGVLLAAGCSLTNAGLQGQTLTAIDAQEESFFSNGDEPYVAVIQFRVTPGIAGSTQVRFLGNLAEIATHIDDGDSATIPAAMAATSFPNVLTAGLSDILDPATAADRLAEATRRVEAAATPSFWRGVGIWFSSFGDPDDVIGFKVLFLVG